jgi:hypothetical protein
MVIVPQVHISPQYSFCPLNKEYVQTENNRKGIVHWSRMDEKNYLCVFIFRRSIMSSLIHMEAEHLSNLRGFARCIRK